MSTWTTTSGAYLPQRFLTAQASPRADTRAVKVATALLFALVFVNESSFRYSDGTQYGLDWQIALRLAVAGCCGLFGCWHLGLTSRDLLKFPGAWGLVFAAWTLVTVPFSANLTYAITSSGGLLCMVLFAPAVLRVLGGKRIVNTVLAGLLVFLVGSWFAYYFVPHIGITEFVTAELEVIRRMGGLAHANSLGRQMALLVGLLTILLVERRVSWKLLGPTLLLALFTLERSGCRTAMLAAMVGSALLIHRNFNWVSKGLLACGAALALVAGGAALGFNADTIISKLARSGESQEMYSFSGRTDLWVPTVAAIIKEPLLGCGYGCGRFVISGFGIEWANYHAHNVLLNTMLCTGVFGGVLLLTMLGCQLRDMWRRPDAFPDCITLLILVGGFADCVMFNPIPDSHTALWMIALYWRQTGAKLDDMRAAPSLEARP